MSKWLEMARAGTPGAGDKRDDRDKTPAIVPNVPNVPLPQAIADGLRGLDPARKPRGVAGDAEAWGQVVKDAWSLGSSGAAAQALALGWSPLDLFGVLDDREGLAVWLRGRRVTLICAATAAAHADGRPVDWYHRRDMQGARVLWKL